MAISKKWKITLLVIFAVIILSVGVTGLAIYWGWSTMQSIAREVYGGSIPAHIMAPVGINIESYKMATYVDTQNQLAMIIVQNPVSGKNKEHSVSEEDVKQALLNFKENQDLETLFKGANQSSPSTIKLGKHTINTLKYTDTSQQSGEIGILNLDHAEMIFVANSNTGQIHSEKVADFLMQMPIIKNDSHFRELKDK